MTLEQELEGLRQSHRWYPIDSAPRDGTRILAYCPDAGKYGFNLMRVTWWRQKKDRTDYIGWGEFNMTYWPPTHWMPLPKAPL